jgi:hypothetical protein
MRTWIAVLDGFVYHGHRSSGFTFQRHNRQLARLRTRSKREINRINLAMQVVITDHFWPSISASSTAAAAVLELELPRPSATAVFDFEL